MFKFNLFPKSIIKVLSDYLYQRPTYLTPSIISNTNVLKETNSTMKKLGFQSKNNKPNKKSSNPADVDNFKNYFNFRSSYFTFSHLKKTKRWDRSLRNFITSLKLKSFNIYSINNSNKNNND
ncbi:hypothetical protein ACTFIZ_010287 [Dictyostelium cf. discoideum]